MGEALRRNCSPTELDLGHNGIIQISDYEAFRVYRSMSLIYNGSVEDVRSYFHSNSYPTDGVQACDIDGHALLLVFFHPNVKEDWGGLLLFIGTRLVTHALSCVHSAFASCERSFEKKKRKRKFSYFPVLPDLFRSFGVCHTSAALHPPLDATYLHLSVAGKCDLLRGNQKS